MKITFDNMSQVNQNNEKVQRSTRAESTIKAYSYNVNVAFDGKDRVGFGTETVVKSKSNVPLTVDSAEAQVQNMRDQMTVLSHTMSDEDFAKMQEEGYDPSEMDPQETVTVLDKIKAELLKAGEHVAGYTDNMDMTTLAAAVGSEALASTLVESFMKQDIPVEKQNVEQVLWALDIAQQIKMPTDSTYYYMAANHMEATLTGFYMAAASGSRLEQVQNTQYFAEEVSGYVTKNIEKGNDENLNMEQEITKLLDKLEIAVGEEEKTVVSWMVERALPVDAESIQNMKDVFRVEFPLDKERVIQTAVAAIADGISVGEKNLADTTTYLEKAVGLYERYQGQEGLSLVQDRRQLEEIRLRMTVETNVKLLKSGFAIDTAPIEETIEALRAAEEELAKQYFPEAENAGVKYQLYKETGNVMKDLPGLPVATVGSWIQRLQEGTLAQFHEQGQQTAEVYKAAGERYETLWTAPRADLGDSIKKAFANVDEILKDLNYEATEENRKAIRTLGYNRMEMTHENVEKVIQAQTRIDRLIHQMTPAATLKMIRDGVNPLERTLTELQAYFEEQPQDYAQSAEKYSKFLYRLDKQGDITPQERDAFIGCYRLLNQIDKADGAALGAVINTGGELNFRNLLSAMRSGRFKSMDVRVNDAIGALSEETVMKFSISEQISRGYEKENATGARAQFEEAAKAPGESFTMLERGELPATAQNVLAAKVLEQSASTVFEKLLDKSFKKLQRTDGWQMLSDKEQFVGEYQEGLAESIDAVETDTLQEADSEMDVRSMRLLYKQLHIMQKLSANEEYYFPMEIGGKITGVHVQFTHSETQQGLIRLTLESREMGRLSGYLQTTEKGVEGYFVGNKEEVVMNLKDSSDIISNSISKEWTFCEIEFVYSESNNIPMDWTRRSAETQVENHRLYSLSKDFLQAVKAVGDGIEER